MTLRMRRRSACCSRSALMDVFGFGVRRGLVRPRA
jgi:hypothetical protein